MTVVFRADASQTIGTGHVMRCLTLAQALRDKGATVEFICREFEGNLCSLIEDKQFRVHRLPNLPSRATEETEVTGLEADWEDDALRTVAVLKELPSKPDWLIVDHYALDKKWEAEVRPYASPLMVIDDLANRPHDCDLLLDQNYLPDSQRYDALVPSSCRKLLGPKYALLREEFGAARETLRERDGEVRRILVSFGGSDPSNETRKVLVAIRDSGFNVAVDVVVGLTNPHRSSLDNFIADMPDTALHIQSDSMAELMVKADLAVGAGGSTMWERCCLGLPSFVVTVAENQEASTAAMAIDGYLFYLGKSVSISETTILKALEGVRNNFFLRNLSKRGLELVDGKGVQRAMRAMHAFCEVKTREAQAPDCDILFEWRNSAVVRRYSLDPSPIPPERHKEWFHASLANPNRHLLIGELNDTPVGVIRYDVDRSRMEAEISVYLAPQQLGKGLGSALMASGEAWLFKREPTLRDIRALVKPDNEASLKLFLDGSFELEYLSLVKSLRG